MGLYELQLILDQIEYKTYIDLVKIREICFATERHKLKKRFKNSSEYWKIDDPLDDDKKTEEQKELPKPKQVEVTQNDIERLKQLKEDYNRLRNGKH